MSIKIFYKYHVNQSYIIEDYNNLTPEQIQQIEKRYSDNMKNDDYVSLVMIIDKEGINNEI